MRRALAIAAVLLIGEGVRLVVTRFDVHHPFFFCGLMLILGGVFCANAALNVHMRRNLDEEFDAGYRVGYRVGRRAPLTSQPVTDLDTFRQRRVNNGGVSQAPIRTLAGDRPPARRDAAYPD